MRDGEAASVYTRKKEMKRRKKKWEEIRFTCVLKKKV